MGELLAEHPSQARGGVLPRLAVAYDITSSSPMELLGLLRGLCRLLWVVDVEDPSLGPMRRFLARSGTVYDTAGRAPDEVADALAVDPALAPSLSADPISGVVAFTDSQLVMAATIADRLGLPGNPLDTVGRFTDKYAQRKAMAAAGLAVPGFVRISPGTEPAAALELAGHLRFPVVLKPLRGDSSRDVVAVEDLGALADALDRVGAHDRPDRHDRSDRTGFIVEEYLADLDRFDRPHPGIGGYVSVESIVVDGRAMPVAVTGKFPLVAPMRETGNFMPHPLDATTAAEVLQQSVEVAAALGVRSGALHTEIKLTPDGPRVIEVNGRIGGGAIDQLYLRRTGRSLTELAALVALGAELDVTREPPVAHDGPFDFEYFLQPPLGATVVWAISGFDRVVGTAGVSSVVANKTTGDDVDGRQGSQGYVLRASGVADDLTSLGRVPDAVTATALVTYTTRIDAVAGL